MALSEAKKKADAKFLKEAYDRIEIKVPKGKKAEIKAHADRFQEASGEIGKAGYSPKGSISGFITRAIDETMERDKRGK